MDKYSILIDRYLKGQLSGSEAEDLKTWLGESDANIVLFNKIKGNWSPFSYQSADVEKALMETRKKAFFGINIRSISMAALKYAAVLIVAFSLYFIGRPTENVPSDTDSVCTVYAPRGQKAKITLPDGSSVVINADSKIEYNTDFHNKREVRLTGEAYFEVEKNPELEFKVLTNSYDVIVHGTRFNVMAYEDYGTTETTLISGAVSVVRDNHTYIMKPGERVAFKENGFVSEKAPTDQIIAWKDKYFVFSSIRFENLIYRLEKWYDVDIEITDEDLKDIIYSGTFKNEETIWQVLDVLTITEGITYEKKGFRKIAIKK
ncbi:MAG: FecR family protein [Marinilabiliaceae bacterium]|nr:FecR family protein [Marinilabiliaceae bacterium]